MLDKAFKLVASVGENFGEAWDLFQKGAQIYSAFNPEEEESSSAGFMPRKKFDFRSGIPTPRAQMRTMEAPIGLKNPNIQTAFRYFADNVARDTNLKNIVAKNYTAGIMRKRTSTKETMDIGSYGTASAGTARSSRVSRSTFRSRL